MPTNEHKKKLIVIHVNTTLTSSTGTHVRYITTFDHRGPALYKLIFSSRARNTYTYGLHAAHPCFFGLIFDRVDMATADVHTSHASNYNRAARRRKRDDYIINR